MSMTPILCIGFLFHPTQAVSECPIAGEFLKNYQCAVAMIRQCAEESEQFNDLTKVLFQIKNHG